MKTTTRNLADLRTGDRILAIGDTTFRTAKTVVTPLAGLPGNPSVQGVYLGILGGGVEDYLYPAAVRGLGIVYERN